MITIFKAFTFRKTYFIDFLQKNQPSAVKPLQAMIKNISKIKESVLKY